MDSSRIAPSDITTPLGYVVVASITIAVALLYSINRTVTAKLAAAPIPARTPTAA